MTNEKMSFADAAAKLLADGGKPLHIRELTQQAIDQNLIKTQAKSPSQTMYAVLSVEEKRNGAESRFIKVKPSTYALRSWNLKSEKETDKSSNASRIRVPHFPSYSGLRAFVQVLDGVAVEAVTKMRGAIHQGRGTVTENVDWTDPDSWINERLVGGHRDLALRIWQGTEHVVNPRHTTGLWLSVRNYCLLEEDSGGLLRLTDRGRDFLELPEGKVVRHIDDYEGVLKIMILIMENKSIATGELMEPWLNYARSVSKYQSQKSIRSALQARLRNLRERDFVVKDGIEYRLTESAQSYLVSTGFADLVDDDEKTINDLLREQKKGIKESIRELLSVMDPYAFEGLVRDLLEEMGYEDVEVTSPGGDGGVDVIGHIQLGITSVKEVIQAKRHSHNIGRHVLDALRGSLHRFGAVRGTIVTTGDFASGTKKAAFEPGAAPITLINGERLVELLIEHGMGVRKRPVELWELDSSPFELQKDDLDDRP